MPDHPEQYQGERFFFVVVHDVPLCLISSPISATGFVEQAKCFLYREPAHQRIVLEFLHGSDRCSLREEHKYPLKDPEIVANQMKFYGDGDLRSVPADGHDHFARTAQFVHFGSNAVMPRYAHACAHDIARKHRVEEELVQATLPSELDREARALMLFQAQHISLMLGCRGVQPRKGRAQGGGNGAGLVEVRCYES
jgi:hypothetical protein